MCYVYLHATAPSFLPPSAAGNILSLLLRGGAVVVGEKRIISRTAWILFFKRLFSPFLNVTKGESACHLYPPKTKVCTWVTSPPPFFAFMKRKIRWLFFRGGESTSLTSSLEVTARTQQGREEVPRSDTPLFPPILYPQQVPTEKSVLENKKRGLLFYPHACGSRRP